LKDNSALELIENTISAISKDSRFSPLTMNEAPEIKIRIDKITSKEVLTDKKIGDIDPTTSGVIVIKKDYSKVACILPNINPKLFIGEDFLPVLEEKLSEKKFVSDDYIIYEIKTEVETSY
jgi:AMMECR1 domain-containing protein